MLVSVLASGSEGNCTYINAGGKKILIDVGMTYKYLTNNLSEMGVIPSEIDYVLITHSHSDHTGAIKQFFKYNKPTVFISKDCLADLDALNGYEDVCTDDGELNLGDIIIETFNTSHDAPGSRGYIINDYEKSFVYVTDTGYINSRLLKKLENHSIYVFESNHDIELLMHGSYPAWLKRRVSSDEGHLSNSQASFYLSKLVGDKTEKVILAHISKENNDPIIALETVRDYFKDNNISFDNFEVAKQRERIEIKI